MKFLKKKIAYKTAVAVLVVFIFVISIIAVFAFNVQNSLISHLQEEKKELIVKYIDQKAKKALQDVVNDIKHSIKLIKSAVAEALYNMDEETEKKAIIVIENVPEGEYSFIVFHDENSDGELEKTWYGMPKEGIANSGNHTKDQITIIQNSQLQGVIKYLILK